MLMISIVYSWQLNKKIIEFHNSKEEFSSLVKVLDNAILRAEYGIDELKVLSNKVALDLNNKIDKAKYLADDLAFITDRANLLGDKLDVSIAEARKFEKVDFIKFHKEQLEQYKFSLSQGKNFSNNGLNDFEPAQLNHSSEKSIPAQNRPMQKVAIESLLAKISAVKNKKEKIEA
jgi:hypothetical protein